MRVVNPYSPIIRSAMLNRGLLRWWMALPFRHGPPRLEDLMRKSTMTLGGALRLGPRGRPGGFGCCVFNGTSDYGQTAAIDLSSFNVLTVSCWYWEDQNNSGNDVIIESSDGGNNNNAGAFFIIPDRSTGNFAVRVRTSISNTNNEYECTRPSAATWHHLVVCMDRNGGAQQVTAIYIDSVSQSLSAIASDTGSSGGFGNLVWNFGARNGGASLQNNCRLDDIRIYNRILPAWEPRALMNASKGGYQRELRWSQDVDFIGQAAAAGATFNYYNRRRRNA